MTISFETFGGQHERIAGNQSQHSDVRGGGGDSSRLAAAAAVVIVLIFVAVVGLVVLQI